MANLTSSQLSALVIKAKTFLGISDDDPRFHRDGIAVYCNSSDATTATVEVTDTALILIDNGTGGGTSTLTLADAANDTLGELVTVVDAVTGWNATLVGRSSDASTNLVRKASTSALAIAEEQVLQIENINQLELFINGAYIALERYLGRDLYTVTDLSELHNFSDSTDQIVLKNPEVSDVSRLGVYLEEGLTATYAGTDEIATVETTSTGVTLRSRTGATTTKNELTFASNVSTGAMATAISAISGWTGAVVTAAPSAYLVQTGAINAKDQTVTLDYFEDYDGSYEVDYDAGIVKFYHTIKPSRGKVLVVYSSGYSTLPLGIEMVLLEAVKAIFDHTKLTSGLSSERLGDYSYTIADQSAASAAAMSAIAANREVLDTYRRILP